MSHDEIIITESTRRQKEEELTHLRTVKRPEVTESIRKAREYGDLSENFEYHAARQSQAILNGRIAELEALLDRARVVEDAGEGGEAVGLGATVTVKFLDDDDEVEEYTIVDATSADPANNRVSYSSPMGKALSHRKKGDVVDVPTPNGSYKLEILALRYA